MINQDGYVAECTGDNIFMIKKGVLYTPPVYMGVLPGITRATVMDLATEMGIKVVEMPITRGELFIADEVFLTGTAAEVVPISSIDGRKIGSGSVGPLTKKLIDRFKEYVKTVGTPIA